MTLALPQYARAELMAELEAAGAAFRGSATKCPFHEDRQASGNVFSDRTTGKWRYKCHAASCPTNHRSGAASSMDMWDVRQWVTGRPLEDILREASEPPLAPKTPERHYSTAAEAVSALERTLGPKSAWWVYHDREGNPMGVTVRWDRPDGKKDIRPVSLHPQGWRPGGMVAPRPLYCLPGLAEAEWVAVVEGEKAADALRGLGFVATTSAHGADSARQTDWTPLAGRECYLWPDNDEGGQQYVDTVADILANLDPPAKVYRVNVEPLRLPPKGDVIEYLDSLADDRQDARQAAVQDVFGDAERLGGDGLRKHIEAIGASRILEMPFDSLNFWSKAMKSGTVTVLCGPAGVSKSFFVLQLMAFFHEQGHKIALYELEDTRDEHLMRLLAQIEGRPEYTDASWVHAHQAQTLAANDRHLDLVESVKGRMTEAPDKPPTYAAAVKWVEDSAKAGCDVIAVDPVTALEAAKEPWAADQRLLIEIKTIARQYGTRVVLVTHPRTGTSRTPGIDAIAGGAAYVRFSHTVLWLESIAEPEEVSVKLRLGQSTEEVNRKIHLLKARNGAGTGLTVGYWFDRATLKFRELGVIAKATKGR